MAEPPKLPSWKAHMFNFSCVSEILMWATNLCFVWVLLFSLSAMSLRQRNTVRRLWHTRVIQQVVHMWKSLFVVTRLWTALLSEVMSWRWMWPVSIAASTCHTLSLWQNVDFRNSWCKSTQSVYRQDTNMHAVVWNIAAMWPRRYVPAAFGIHILI